MKINIEQQSQSTFCAKVTPRFVNSMRGFINRGSNRLKNNYLLDTKLKEYENFGYNDYTVELNQISGPLGFEYILRAVKDGQNSEDGVILAKRSSYRKIFERFMNYKKYDFCNKIKANKSK